MSTPTQVADFLENLNAWRRGDEAIEMPSPYDIGCAIESAVKLLREHEELERRAERLALALKDAISTYDPTRKETLVTAERQEAWIAALKEGAK
jgi:hypothetical protein